MLSMKSRVKIVCLCILGMMITSVALAGGDVQVKNSTAHRLKIYVKQYYQERGQSTIYRGELGPRQTISASTSSRLGKVASIKVLAQKLNGRTIERKYESYADYVKGRVTRISITEADLTYPKQ